MLEGIRLKNFKTARNLDLNVAPLTVLAGLNGSGKSTVLQSLSLLRQSYAGGQATGLTLGGSLVQLGLGADVRSERAEDDFVGLAVQESGVKYQWLCACVADANQLSFVEYPAGGPPNFVKTPYFQYLQADRIVPQTLYPQAPQQAREDGFLGAHGEFTADFLAQNETMDVAERRRYKSERSPSDGSLSLKVAPTSKLPDQVSGWLQVLSPGVRLKAERVKGTDEVILQFNYVGLARGMEPGNYRPTNVGFGLTYSLPLLVGCLAAKAGALLLIENPEAHLHPQGQTALGELLSLCAADGVQVIVETHSDHVLNGIRLSVKRRHVTAEEVKLFYFTRDMATGDCSVESPSVLSNGQLSNWPTGFFDQWERSLDALLDE